MNTAREARAVKEILFTSSQDITITRSCRLWRFIYIKERDTKEHHCYDCQTGGIQDSYNLLGPFRQRAGEIAQTAKYLARCSAFTEYRGSEERLSYLYQLLLNKAELVKLPRDLVLVYRHMGKYTPFPYTHGEQSPYCWTRNQYPFSDCPYYATAMGFRRHEHLVPN